MRFKMYKSGKYWAVGSLLIAGLFGTVTVQSNNVSADANSSSSSLVGSSPSASVGADNPTTAANGITKNDQGLVDYVNGVKQTNAWDQTNTYYFGADGQAVSGLQTIDGKQYYFGDDQTYTVRKNTEVTVNNQTYTADQNGVLTAKNGLEKNQNGYVDYTNGTKQTNAWDQTNTYYFGADGQAVSGLQTIDGKQYYFGDDQTYTVRKNTEVTVNNQTYTADQNGILTAKNGLEKNQNGYVDYTNGTKQTNAWDQTNTYYFGADGQAVSGLQTIDGKQY
ncbi:KxYKxGKxW signal peptide domain-containing protein, partial [Fructobacillus evanidus]|uniref:KxYKxGKxW signal peptide domain-containing protein n=1 Tax=Fructobacillus evanidus TaxID=3064281 RepID=UPI0030C8A04B